MTKTRKTDRNDPSAASVYCGSRNPPISIMFLAATFRVRGRRGFSVIQATERHRSAVNAVIRTAQGKPTFGISFCSIMGYTTPPPEEPAPTIPRTSPRRRRNHCPRMARLGVKLRALSFRNAHSGLMAKLITYMNAHPMPNRIPCARKNWYGLFSSQKDVRIVEITSMNVPDGSRIWGKLNRTPSHELRKSPTFVPYASKIRPTTGPRPYKRKSCMAPMRDIVDEEDFDSKFVV